MVRGKAVLLSVSRVCAALGVVLPFGAVVVLVVVVVGSLLAHAGWITVDQWPQWLLLGAVLLWPCLAFAGLITTLVGLPSWSDRLDGWPVVSLSLSLGLTLFAVVYLYIYVATWLFGP